jgi:hypothetical protein
MSDATHHGAESPPMGAEAEIVASCARCVYAHPRPRIDVRTDAIPPVTFRGHCCRYPPGPGIPDAPSVDVDDWCGEFIPASPPPGALVVTNPIGDVIGGIVVEAQVGHTEPAGVERPNPSRPST